ncbi:hypothetical protein Cgig2_000818 [Carnegiea gigantea]|uniref:Peroxisome biogenesis protein 22 n=1 Tax=Carnegiea gigantea TaxID=171969 RepID=A0A9Q1QJV9_9CARY|nr:hypothetical protein Cgig2_000818 [Carnegiea gigantea]
MADSSKDELLQLIRRFSAYLSVKMSNFFTVAFHKLACVAFAAMDFVSFNNFGLKASIFMPYISSEQDACWHTLTYKELKTVVDSLIHSGILDVFSVGAIAGLAIAIIFTWRVFPTAPQRRQPKRQATGAGSSGVNSQSNATLLSSGASASSEDSRAQNVVDDFFQPVKVVHGHYSAFIFFCQVTCRLVGVVLEETSVEELQKKATVRPSVLEVLLEITKFCDLYLMDRVLDDESEKRVLVALEEAGVFTSGGLIKDKVLFCSTENGRTSFVRQLEPDWHIDTNPEIISQLARFIKYQLHVSPSRTERMAANVFSSPSLEHFFGCT